MILVEMILGGILAAGVLCLYKSRSNLAMKSFFAGTLTIAALIYVGFAIFGVVTGTATASWLLIEFIGLGIYFTFAHFGFRRSAMLLAIGWAARRLGFSNQLCGGDVVCTTFLSGHLFRI